MIARDRKEEEKIDGVKKDRRKDEDALNGT